MDNMTYNASLGDEPFVDQTPFMVFYCLLFVISIIVNSLIVWIVFKDSRLKTTTNVLVANIAVSDVIATVCGCTEEIAYIQLHGIWLVSGVFGNVLCKMSAFFLKVSFAVSLYSCVFMAIDRYYTLAYPAMKKPLRRNIKYIIAGIWIASSLINAGLLYYIELKEKYFEAIGDSFSYCGVKRGPFEIYRLVVMILVEGLPIVVISVIYTLILVKLYHHKVPGQQTSSAIRRRELKNRKVLKMSVTIVAMLYFSIGFSFVVFVLIHNRKLDHLSESSLFIVYQVSNIMLYLSLIYNFFIYLIFNDIYRKNIKSVMVKCWRPFCF